MRERMGRSGGHVAAAAFGALVLAVGAAGAGAADGAAGAASPAPSSKLEAQSGQPAAGAGSGLPVPRFVSLKSDRVNMRNGPGTEYPTAWVYKRAGLPIEVIREFEGWRQVRDSEGATGWILQSFLSGRRTALIEPWELKPGKPAPQVAIRSSDSDGAQPVVRLEAGVIAAVQSCDGKWCYVSVERFRGYIEQKKLWGVYPSEVVK